MSNLERSYLMNEHELDAHNATQEFQVREDAFRFRSTSEGAARTRKPFDKWSITYILIIRMLEIRLQILKSKQMGEKQLPLLNRLTYMVFSRFRANFLLDNHK